MGNIFQKKRYIDNHVRKLEGKRSLLHCLKISGTLVHKRLKMGPEFSRTLSKLCILLRCQVLHTANGTQPNFPKLEEVNGANASRIGWRRIVNVNETIEIRSLVSRSPKTRLG